MSSVGEQGQGAEAIFAQIAADAVGVDIDRVRVVTGDTDATPYGGGTWASRGAGIGGEAVLQAGQVLRENILTTAEAILQARRAGLDGASRRDRRCAHRRTNCCSTGRARPHRLLPLRHAAEGLHARADGHAPLRAARLPVHLHQRRAGQPCRGRRRHRLREAAQALGGGGLRPRHQPDAGGRADARRHRAGHRRRAVRGVPVRRQTARCATATWPTTWCRWPAEMPDIVVAHVQTPTAQLAARRQGRRRGRHRRRAGRGDERDQRRARALRRARVARSRSRRRRSCARWAGSEPSRQHPRAAASPRSSSGSARASGPAGAWRPTSGGRTGLRAAP